MKPKQCIFVVDRDRTTAAWVNRVCGSLKADCRSYATVEQFLRGYDRQTPGCVVAEIRLAASAGTDFQQHLADEQIRLPVVFVTDGVELRVVTQVMRSGAMTVLKKPLDDNTLRIALREALTRDADTRRIDAAHASLRHRFAGLSRQDRVVLRSMMAGQSTSQIAADLNVDVPTIDAWLTRILKKTQCTTLIDLARLAVDAKLDAETE